MQIKSRNPELGTVQLTPELDEAISGYQAALGLTRAAVVREALIEFLAGRGLLDPEVPQPRSYVRKAEL